MTDHRNDDDPTPAIMTGIERMLAESRAINTRESLKGIPIRRIAPKHTHISRKRRTL